MIRVAVVAIAAALGLCACGGPAPPRTAPRAKAPAPAPARILAKYDVMVLRYPATDTPPTGFTVTETGLVLVPVRGGVGVAGWNGWAIEPQQRPVVSVAATRDALVVVDATDGGASISRWEKHAKVGDLGTLPAGVYQVVATPSEALWISGRQANGRWALFHAEKGKSVGRVAEMDARVEAVAPAGEAAAVAAVGRDLVMLRRGGSPVRLVRTTEDIEGVAVEPRGTVLFTTKSGLFRLDKPGHARILAVGIHGPVHERAGRIFVLRREQHEVLSLTPPMLPR